ncbi:hypothetical protein niasHT_039643 [Heterodera trifolii]|uniref:E3 ubiquitin-protein ligase E3D n=1 Tax=Heterodera trifolii TaxID=157864 RepID=A0ABD2IU69_9BILA
MENCLLNGNESWRSGSFLLEMKPSTDLASLFVSLPGPVSNEGKAVDEPLGIMRVDDQSLEIAFDVQDIAEQTGCQSADFSSSMFFQKFGAKFVDIVLEPTTLCSPSWADAQQRLIMCKVRAEADCVTFAPKTIGRLEEELAQRCLLREYVERIEHNRTFHVNCRRCGHLIHSHSKGDFVFGVFPNDDWLETAPQMDYFCALSSDCCGAHLEMSSVQPRNSGEGILGFSPVLSADSSRHWLPGERKIVFSNSFILFQNTDKLAKEVTEVATEGLPFRIVSCTKCNTHLGTTLKSHPNVFKLHMSVLHVYGDSHQRSAYTSNRFLSMESFLAWMLLNKCEHHSSVKLIVRSLDRNPHLLIWLLEPYVLLTKGVLCSVHFPATANQQNLLLNSLPNDNNAASITFPALKVLYKCFDTFDSKQDPRANGCDSSVGILELPTDSCLRLTEMLLSSSLSLPPPLRALGQFYVGFIRMKDRVD